MLQLHPIPKIAMLSQHIQNLPRTHFPLKLRDRLQHIPHKQSFRLHIKAFRIKVHNRNRIIIQITATIHIKIMYDINLTNNNDHKNPYIQKPSNNMGYDNGKLVSISCTLYFL